MISRARPPDPAVVPEKDEGGKKKGEAKKDVRVRGKRKKKKERKVFFGSVCGSHKTVEIIE